MRWLEKWIKEGQAKKLRKKFQSVKVSNDNNRVEETTSPMSEDVSDKQKSKSVRNETQKKWMKA